MYDPHKKTVGSDFKLVSLSELLSQSDVISFHIHVTHETFQMVNRTWFFRMKPKVLLINTSRGEIVEENDLVQFLNNHPESFYAADVVSGETQDRSRSPLLKAARHGDQCLLTPHVGGMTREGQWIAYHHAAKMLEDFLNRHKK